MNKIKSKRFLFLWFFLEKLWEIVSWTKIFSCQKKTVIKSCKVIDMLIRHSCDTIFWKPCSKKRWSGLVCFGTYKRICVLSKCLHLRTFDMRFLSYHGFCLSIFLLIKHHFIKTLDLNSLFSKAIPTTPNNLWHFAWFTTRAIFFWLNLFCIHFVFEFFCL